MSNVKWSELEETGLNDEQCCNADVFDGQFHLWLTSSAKGWIANINNEGGDLVLESDKGIKDFDDAKDYAESLFRGYIKCQLLEMGGESLRFTSMKGCDNRLYGLTEQGIVYIQDPSRKGWTPEKMKALY